MIDELLVDLTSMGEFVPHADDLFILGKRNSPVEIEGTELTRIVNARSQKVGVAVSKEENHQDLAERKFTSSPIG